MVSSTSGKVDHLRTKILHVLVRQLPAIFRSSGPALARAGWARGPSHISRPTYHRLRAEGRGPVEMRIGLNVIRITADAEREWQRRMERDDREFEARATERAVKAGDAAVKSDLHVSKKWRARNRRKRGEPANQEERQT